MEHIELFESFGNTPGFSAVVLFAENQMAVGCFPSSEAIRIYEKLQKLVRIDEDIYGVEMVEIPQGHDLVVVPLIGREISTSNEEEMENYGDPVHDVVELGRFYDYGENPSQMFFRVNTDVNGFVVVDSAGGTRLLSPEEIESIIY